MISAGIYGATGYTGLELVKILQRHPDVKIGFATSNTFAGKTLSQVYASAPAQALCLPDEADLSSVDVAFLCLPHAAAAGTAIKCLAAGVRVVDLSADFRLKDVDVYEKWYKVEHPQPDLLDEAVYGLVEFARPKLPKSRLVAVPGCYPTSVLLGAQPMLAGNMVEGTIIADSKSGVSGAGRTPKQLTHYVEVEGNFTPYAIGRKHRHHPEMQQVMSWFNADVPPLIFTPHLLPVPRGILSTIYLPTSAPYSAIREAYENTYAGEKFVTVLPDGETATLAHAVNTNKCVMSLSYMDGMLVVVSVIDNLIKGASGQAVQNMNVMFGCDEDAGLI